MFDGILVAVDGSDQSMVAAEKAVQLAADQGAELHVLFVAEIHPTYTRQGGSILAQDEEQPEQIEYGEQVTGEVADMAQDAGVECVSLVKSGTPSHVINDYAEKEELDLIVMGTYGRSGIRDRLTGSTTERVIRKSTKSVLAVR